MSDIRHINPDEIYDSLASRGYTQVVTVETPGRLIFVSGQMPLDRDNNVVGAGDIEAQTRAVFANLEAALKSAGGSLANVVKLTAFVTDVVKHPPLIRKVRAEVFGTAKPPASTMVEVPRFAHPDVMVEVEAVCVG